MKLFFVLALLSWCACASESGTGGNSGTGGGAGMAGSGGSVGAGGNPGSGGGAGAGGDAGVGGAGGMDSGVSERVVFVTSTAQAADFGGIDGADALCASEATAAGLEGEFRAWLSTSESAVADRFVRSTVPYVLVDGTRIADDWADLTDPMDPMDPMDSYLQVRLNRDANGIERGGDVWTGTLPSGLAADRDDCDGFTALSGTALCGSTQSIFGPWTASQYPSCGTSLRLYCFEQ